MIAMSGVASAMSRERTRQAGFSGYIRKPFDEAAVVAAIGAALALRDASAPPG